MKIEDQIQKRLNNVKYPLDLTPYANDLIYILINQLGFKFNNNFFPSLELKFYNEDLKKYLVYKNIPKKDLWTIYEIIFLDGGVSGDQKDLKSQGTLFIEPLINKDTKDKLYNLIYSNIKNSPEYIDHFMKMRKLKIHNITKSI